MVLQNILAELRVITDMEDEVYKRGDVLSPYEVLTEFYHPEGESYVFVEGN